MLISFAVTAKLFCVFVFAYAKTKNKNSSFKSSENIQKKECGPDRSVSDNQSSSVALNNMNKLAMKARKSYCNFKFKQRSHTMTDIKPSEVQII